jgi:predicted kinase
MELSVPAPAPPPPPPAAPTPTPSSGDGARMRRVESLEELAGLTTVPPGSPRCRSRKTGGEASSAGAPAHGRAAASGVNGGGAAAEQRSMRGSMGAIGAAADYNPMPQETCPPADAESGTYGDRVVVVMVGLPARGKTFIARKLAAYLSFFHGAQIQTFNIAEYRRRLGASDDHSAAFFEDNTSGKAARDKFAEAAMSDMKAWLSADMSLGRVGIFDGTNCTQDRRQWILRSLSDVLISKSNVIFVESVCHDESIINHNILATKANSPDYAGMEDKALAVADFKRRIQAYERRFSLPADHAAPPALQPASHSVKISAVETGWLTRQRAQVSDAAGRLLARGAGSVSVLSVRVRVKIMGLIIIRID